MDTSRAGSSKKLEPQAKPSRAVPFSEPSRLDPVSPRAELWLELLARARFLGNPLVSVVGWNKQTAGPVDRRIPAFSVVKQSATLLPLPFHFLSKQERIISSHQMAAHNPPPTVSTIEDDIQALYKKMAGRWGFFFPSVLRCPPSDPCFQTLTRELPTCEPSVDLKVPCSMPFYTSEE
jgi:hypothetical protein